MDGVYVINLDEYRDAGTHWIALFCHKKLSFILIILVLNMLDNKFKNLLGTKT